MQAQPKLEILRKKSHKRRPSPVALGLPKPLNAAGAAIAAGFLPVASFTMAHTEAAQAPVKWALVAAALAYSAPTVASWAAGWIPHSVTPSGRLIPVLWKAWAFSVLLEGVLVSSSTHWLAYGALAVLCLVNVLAAIANALR